MAQQWGCYCTFVLCPGVLVHSNHHSQRRRKTVGFLKSSSDLRGTYTQTIANAHTGNIMYVQKMSYHCHSFSFQWVKELSTQQAEVKEDSKWQINRSFRSHSIKSGLHSVQQKCLGQPHDSEQRHHHQMGPYKHPAETEWGSCCHWELPVELSVPEWVCSFPSTGILCVGDKQQQPLLKSCFTSLLLSGMWYF